jgi:DNA-binding response OmpR family regulator
MRRRGNEAEPRGAGELRWGSIVLDRGRHTASVADAQLVLTRTEYSLLASLVAAAGHVVSHSALLSAGWPGEPNPDPQWLKPHLARLRFKLGEAGAPVPASVRGVGYRLEEAG